MQYAISSGEIPCTASIRDPPFDTNKIAILGIPNASRAAIRSVDTFEGQIAASLAGLISVALYLPPFAFVANRDDEP